MKNILFLAAGAAALSLASCSNEKTTETTTTTETTAPPADAMASTDMDAMYQARAQRISDKFYQDMKITDEATKAKIRTAYYNRSKRMGDMKAKYTTDTTGMAAASRQAMTDTDTEFKGILTDPAQYQSYESSRATYDESNYMDDNAGSSSMTAGDDAASGSTGTDNAGAMSADNGKMSADNSGAMSGDMVAKGKMKMEDGSKVKMKEDGKMKTKDADGEKEKMK